MRSCSFEAMRDRLAAVKPEEAMAAAREMRLDFTEEKFKEVLTSDELEELSREKLEDVAGGIHKLTDTFRLKYTCKNNGGNGHVWEYKGHKEIPGNFLFISWTNGYNYFKCTLCGLEVKTQDKTPKPQSRVSHWDVD